jgi:hypothetical protein
MRDSIKWAALAALTLTACSRGDKPDTFIQAGLKAAAGEPVALWKALPPSYQKDVNDTIGAFAAKLPEQPWNDGFVIAGKVVKVLETKKTFVLGHPALADGPIKAADLAKGWDPAVRIVSTLVNSDIKTVAGLKAFDVGKFLEGPAASLIKDGLSLAESAGDALPNKGAAKLAEMREKLKGAKITVENAADDKATVKVEIPGENTETTEMVKVDGKWLPKEMVDQWPSAVAGAKASISTIEVPPEMIVQFNAMKGAVEPVLDGLLAADSQEAFNAQVDALMKGVMGGSRDPVADAPPPSEEPALADAPPPAPVAKANEKKKKKKKKSE